MHMSSDYESLLNNVYENMPKHEKSAERFELPNIIVLSQGNKTIVKNFKELCDAMRREPSIVSKYLSKELAAPSNYDGKQLIFNGKISESLIKSKVSDFVEKYIKCKICGRYDTHFEAIDRNIRVLKCEACGATSPVRL